MGELFNDFAVFLKEHTINKQFMIFKYIILEENNSSIIFDKLLLHSDVAKPFGPVKSAGFRKISLHNKEIRVSCFGESSSLQINSNPIEDQDSIRLTFFKNTAKNIVFEDV